MHSLAREAAPRPWYREPWPWLLMVGPVTVIIAGIITLVYAVQSFDGLVADDYYKRGLTVNQELGRIKRAETLRVSATLTFDATQDQFSATMNASAPLPAVLQLRMTHPTRAGEDRLITLTRNASGIYTGQGKLQQTARWNVRLESAEWLLPGSWPHPDRAAIVLGTPSPSPDPARTP